MPEKTLLSKNRSTTLREHNRRKTPHYFHNQISTFIQKFAVVLLFSNVCSANTLSYFYSPSAGVRGDIAENDLIINDDFRFLTIEPGFLRAIRLTIKSKTPFYLEYSSISTEDDSGNVDRDRYQSFSFGTGFYNVNEINGFSSYYWDLTGGVGVARFNFDDVKKYALGEVSVGFGLILADVATVGLAYKYQIVGYPSETMARSGVAAISIGLHFK